MTVTVALGDSLTCGLGVGVRVAADATWVALLAAAAAPGGTLVRLAEPGARIHDLRLRQVPCAPSADVVTVLAGLNDVARAGFAEAEMREDMHWMLKKLTAQGATVLLGRLHDPGMMLPLPGSLRAVVRQRVAVVNEIVDEASGWPGILTLDLAGIQALQRPGGWSTDRIHPSRVGHQAVAAAAAAVLIRHGHSWRPLPEPHVPAGPSVAATGWWAMRYGMPYLARHIREFAPPIMSAVARGL